MDDDISDENEMFYILTDRKSSLLPQQTAEFDPEME